MEKLRELQAQQRELSAKMDEANKAGDVATYEALKRELETALTKGQMAVQAEQARQLASNQKRDKKAAFREMVKDAVHGSGKMVDAVLELREITSGIINTGDTNNMESAGFPVTVKELLEPLEVETVYSKVGLRVESGVGGTIQWPCLDSITEVEVMGETVEVGDTDLDFSKIVPVQRRLAISTTVTNESLENASFDLYGTVVGNLRNSLARVINKAVVGTEAVGQLVGPFASGDTKLGSITFAGEMPTFKELLQMKGIVAGTGADIKGFCYIMNTFTYATLEATSKTESNGGMIVEGGKIGGYPVFVTDSEKIADGCVNAGCFNYAALLQHGDLHLIIDPYTKAKKNEVMFTLNTNISLTTLKAEAFCVGTCA